MMLLLVLVLVVALFLFLTRATVVCGVQNANCRIATSYFPIEIANRERERKARPQQRPLLFEF